MDTDLMPGRELDALVAEKVMGWKVFEGRFTVGPHYREPGSPASSETPVPNYSSDIAAAWEVVEELDGTYEPTIERHGPGWTAWFDSTCSWAETAPHAICLAALKVVSSHP